MDIEREAQFLIERLRQFESENMDESAFRDWSGHVCPSIARLELLLEAAHPPAKVPEPFGTQSAYEVACKSELMGSNMNISCNLVRELVEALRKVNGGGEE